MHTPTEKVGSFQPFLIAKAIGSNNSSSSSVESWPAPAPKPNPLVLKRSSTGSSSPLLQPDRLFTSASDTPFQSPVQESAFAVPRPVAVAGASSPWAPPTQDSDASVLRRSAVVQPEIKFTRPPFFAEKRSARHPWQLSRSC
jgi:hypothetical protein